MRALIFFFYFNYLDVRTMTLHDVQGTQLSSVEQGAFPVNKSKEYAEQYPATVVDNPAAQLGMAGGHRQTRGSGNRLCTDQ